MAATKSPRKTKIRRKARNIDADNSDESSDFTPVKKRKRRASDQCTPKKAILSQSPPTKKSSYQGLVKHEVKGLRKKIVKGTNTSDPIPENEDSHSLVIEVSSSNDQIECREKDCIENLEKNKNLDKENGKSSLGKVTNPIVDGCIDIFIPNAVAGNNPSCTLLVQLNPEQASNLDFEGASGAIGRFEAHKESITLDLKGFQYNGLLHPGPTAMIVNLSKQSGVAKVEALTDEFITLEKTQDVMAKLDAVVSGNMDDYTFVEENVNRRNNTKEGEVERDEKGDIKEEKTSAPRKRKSAAKRKKK